MELTFGEQIKIILKRKNMTIRQLAELVEVQTGKPMSRQNLTQKLNRDNFQEQDMKEIAQALGCVVKISVTDPMEAALVPQNMAIPQNAAGEMLPPGGPEEIGKQEAVRAAAKNESRKAGKHSAGRLRAGRPGGHLGEMDQQELAKREAAVTKQPLPEDLEGNDKGAFLPDEHAAGKEEEPNADILKEIEVALMESIQKEMNPEKSFAGVVKGQIKEKKPEVDTLSWAKQKPSVWPTLTVPKRVPETIGPPLPDEMLVDAGSLSDVEAPSDAGELMEPSSGDNSLSETDTLPEKESVEKTDFSEEERQEETPLPFESEEPLLEDVPLEESEDLEDLEFFDLEDFDGEEIFQVSAPYVIKRENPEDQKKTEESEKREKIPEKRKLLRKEKPLKEKRMFRQEEAVQAEEPLSDGNGDISFASAPYVIPREQEEKSAQTEEPENGRFEEEQLAEEVLTEEPLKKESAEERQSSDQKELPEELEENEEAQKGFRPFGRLSGSSKGDISSVSAPYVIPRRPEDQNIRKTGEKPKEQYPDEAGPSEVGKDERESWQEAYEEPEEEESLSPDMEEKIASWDAAVKRQLANPFRSFEGRRLRRMSGGATREEESRENQAVVKSLEEAENQTGPDEGGKAQPDQQPETKRKEAPETEGQTETDNSENRTETPPNMDSSESRDKRERPEESETVDLQGPAFDPVTGAEYETNTVKHHPFKEDMLLVYDQDEHRWIVQSERAFLNFQINKRALLGKDYEPPVYLD